MMSGQGLGGVLRTHRECLQLTQEELAQRAGLAVRTVRELEAGRVLRPRGHSLRLLADALGLDDEARTDFMSGAYRTSRFPDSAEVPRQLPGEVAGFAGRHDVLAALDDSLHASESGSSEVGIR